MSPMAAPGGASNLWRSRKFPDPRTHFAGQSGSNVSRRARNPSPMTVRLAIDPGPERSAWLVLGPAGGVRSFGIWPNDQLLDLLRNGSDSSYLGGRGTAAPIRMSRDVEAIAIEKVESFGMAVGAEVFETVFWSGRFAEAAWCYRVERITRRAVKLHLCGSARAKDTNIRQALIDRYGGSAAIGKKAAPGPLFGISKDVWSALAVAVTAADTLS